MTEKADIHDAFTLASYTPRGFFIKLEAPMFQEPPEEGPLAFCPKTFPIFMHEVAHLVQDRATFRGIIDFLDFWDRVSAVSEHNRTCDENLEIPLVDAHTGQSRLQESYQWALETERLRGLREPRKSWESQERTWAYASHHVVSIETRLAGRRITYPIVTVRFVDNVTLDEYEHSLGAWEIKEAYSVAVAMIHGGAQPEFGKKNFEYLVIERILSGFFGEIAPSQMIAVCHWCLQDLSPANTLISLIEHYEAEGALPDALSIYGHARSDAMTRGFAENVRDVLNNVREYSSQLGRQNEPLRVLFEWYLHHAERLLTLHLNDVRYFPLDTFLCNANPYDSAEVQNAGLRELFSEVEVPLIIWPNGATHSISDDSIQAGSSVFLNQAVFHLLHQLWTSTSDSWSCPIQTGCNLPMKDELECSTTPWKQVRHFPSCPYGAAAKILNLTETIEIQVTRIESSGRADT